MATVKEQIQSLTDILTNAIDSEGVDNVPARSVEDVSIFIKTGTYREVLPIIVPESTVVLGDELRSTNAGPAGSITHRSDANYSQNTLKYLSSAVQSVVIGNDFGALAGNNEVQSQAYPFADTPQTRELKSLVSLMQNNIDFRIGTINSAEFTDPDGYNDTFLPTFGNARKLITYNKEFLKAEVVAYIGRVNPNLLYSKTKCKQDVGYIIDALTYDLTYGGDTQTLIAGLAYYDGVSSTLSIDSSEKAATIDAYTFLRSRITSVVSSVELPSPEQTEVKQFTDTPGNNASVTFAQTAIDKIIAIINGGVDNAPNITVNSISGTDTLNTGVAHGLEVGDAVIFRENYEPASIELEAGIRYWVVDVPSTASLKIGTEIDGSVITLTNGSNLGLVADVIDYPETSWVPAALLEDMSTALDANQETLVSQLTSYIASEFSDLEYNVSKCERDTRYILDAIGWDIRLGSNFQTLKNAYAYLRSTSSEVYNLGQKKATRDAYQNLKDIILNDSATYLGTDANEIGGYILGTGTGMMGSGYGYYYPLYLDENAAIGADDGSNEELGAGAHVHTFVEYPNITFYMPNKFMNHAQDDKPTDLRQNIGAATFDLFDLLDSIIFSGSNEGTNSASRFRNDDYAVHQLEMNKDYIINEMTAYIKKTFRDTVNLLQDSTSYLSISDTGWLRRDAAIKFSGNVQGNIVADKTYYVQNIIDNNNFTISETRNSNSPLQIDVNPDAEPPSNEELSTNFTVSLDYSESSCERDVAAYIEALKYDLKYPGNYKSLFAARYYGNSVIGSLEEDMYLVRNGTGVRNQTLEGLRGDVLPENEFGTSRVSAGAYVSLDPGWGPDDDRTWVKTRSCYVQGVTTFGYAAIGQKIDGALHNGGNDSIVSNDFTQVISDGIGAWVTNNGRAELVSVFTYYARIGYLSENGGRIRGTNGNCSYGTFGAVAEGFDADEVPITATVENRDGFDAVIGSVTTDGFNILGFEFDHAGNEYTSASYIITGGGVNAEVEDDEFRDDAVFQVRGLDLGDDSSGQFGGDGYLTNSNTAQGGTTTSVSLAAVDQEVSSAYPGMKVVLDGGKGAGQFGIITTYNAGTKQADVVRESDGQPGWDHFVPGTAIVAPDPSTTYVVEPAISLTSPGFASTPSSLTQSATWSDIIYGNTASEYLDQAVDVYTGSGTGASFNITRNATKYFVTLEDGGEEYTRLETLTINGSTLDGEDEVNDIVITITAVNSTTGEILEFDFEGSAFGGRYVAVNTDNNNGAYSNDGETWATTALPAAPNGYSSVAAGLIDDGSSLLKIPRFVAVSPNSSVAAYSEDGISWTSTTLPETADWTSVTFGEGKFVAVATDTTTVAVSNDGEVWDITSTLTRTGANDVAYGKGRWVVVFDNSGSGDGVNYSSNALGIWSSPDNGDQQMPTGANWVSVTWGQGAFVAVAADTNTGAISIDGVNWSAMTVGSPDSTDPAGYNKVRYGQGLFMATLEDTTAGITGYSYIAKSEDGLFWEFEGIPDNGNTVNGFNAIAFGNPNSTGYWAIIENQTTDRGARVRTGATAKARAFVAETKIFQIRLLEPGSGYDNTPTLTITDPNNIFEAPFQIRIGKGALATPSFIDRGEDYGSANAEIDSVNSNGFADFFQSGNFVFVKRLSKRPIPGSNIVFDSLPNRVFRLVNVITFLGQNDGAYTAFLQLSPEISIQEAPPQDDGVTTRIRYSQVRLTNHDFLDIGTGNFVTSNYPNEPLIDPDPGKETTDSNGGRVFFTSTDQDGNFRVGDLFTIEQSTGVATLNADAFNIAGLQELSLGEVTLGGGSASIDEFSTDPFFTADSDSIVPTQRAVKAYIAAQIGGGGASLNVNSVTAGSIFINTNQIRTTDQSVIQMRGQFNFEAEINGYPLAWNYFLN